MLRELHITNLAVIEDVSIDLAEGFNCFTGQTGAGKSLVLGAFEILLAMRSGGLADMVRPGASEARVSGVFELHDPWVCQQVGALLDARIEQGGQLLIRRRLLATGRTSATVDGQPATAAMLRQIGSLLVDVHGQHDHQYLLQPAHQLAVLDAYARTQAMRALFGAQYAALRDMRRRREALLASRSLRRQQLELYLFQAEEIDAAEPVEGELAELAARHTLLGSIQRIRTEAGQVYAALHESEGAIVERLQIAVHVLQDLAELDGSLRDVAEPVRAATLALQDCAFDLRRYVDRLELDPGELAEVEQRLNALNRLVSKYAAEGGAESDGLAAVLAYRCDIGEAIERLRGEDEDVNRLEDDIEARQSALDELGRDLSARRRRAAQKLAPLVEAELADLGMSDARFVVAFEAEDPSGPSTADPGVASVGGGASGIDRIEMLVGTNPGQPARPLRRIASGGELSRIMLAVKSILSHADRTSVIVFDEIDANIGGRMGTVIGTKLRMLADGGRGGGRASSGRAEAASHQVLCITHLPQIAAFADHHLRIDKKVAGRGRTRRTRTAVTILDPEARIEELAEMLAGKQASSTTRRQAKEMLESARS